MLFGAALLGAAFVAALGASGSMPTADAASGLHYQRGYYVANGMLCYGWANGVYHCTGHWHRSGSSLVSDNPSWVPNAASTGGTSSAASKPSTSAVKVTSSNTAGQPCRSSYMFPAHISQWTVPVSCYAGVYRVNVEQPGFGPFVARAELTMNQEFWLQVPLQIGSVLQAVEVTAPFVPVDRALCEISL